MRKKANGSLTVEASVIIPLILFIFGILLHILFYYHDKNILLGIAHETAAIGSGREDMSAHDLEHFAFAKAKQRLLFMEDIDSDVYIEKEFIRVVCSAHKGNMSTEVECRMSRTEPEDSIRSVRKIKKIQEGTGKKD